MRITRLHLENFRIHRNSTLEFNGSSLVMIRGRNWSGKSSIGQGLSMCFTPSTTGLDPRGNDFASKIRRGEDKAVITADVQTKTHLIRRTVTLNAGVAGRRRTSECLSKPDWNPGPFDDKLDALKPALTVALNTDAFLRMDPKEQMNLLAGLALPARYEFDAEIVASVDAILGSGKVNFQGEPFAAINKAYKLLFDERTIVNRQVREFIIPESLPVPAGVDSLSLQENITHLRMERRDRERERDQAVHAAAKAEAERERVRAKRQSLLPDEKLAELRAVVGKKEEFDRLNAERKRTETVLDEYLAQLAHYEEIPEDGSKCPTCDQPIDLDRLKEMVAIATESMKEVRDQHSGLIRQIREMGDVEAAIRAVAQHEAVLKELEAAKVSESAPFDFQPYEQSLAEIDAEVETLGNQLRPVIAAEERRKEIAIRQGQLKRLKENAALLDRLVKYFDKDGIKAKLIGDYIGGFEHKLNEVMSAWGYGCSLSIEPYSFDISTARGDVIPVRELSGAERIMFSLAFQCAVARTAGIGMVVIDEVAMFEPELRPVLNKRLWEMIQNGYLEQVILLVADSSEQPPKVPGSAVFMVEDGEVHELRSQLVA
jgi:DNA repair exonuclease SbcCD ATPase subunit